MGGLPTRNFRSGRFEGVEKISGERMAELRKIRGGKMHACMPTCAVGCSPIFLNQDGEYVTSAFEYESLAMFGSNLEIDDIDAIAEMDRLCDDYGLDTIETGSALAVAAEAGLMDFGDSTKAKDLINEMEQGTLLGRILGQGAVIAARVLGVSRVAAVKGQAMSAHEPRVFKGTGVTLATSPMGADHTAGLIFSSAAIPKDQIPELSRHVQINTALLDSTGCCQIPYGPLGASITQKLLNALYGLELTEKDVLEIGKAVLLEESKFNQAAGISEAHNRLPEFFLEETLPPLNATFDLSEKEVRDIFKDLDSPVRIPAIWQELLKSVQGKKQ
jgi:aldehyde:ferredoxin oxidoreductase